jgi:hypothetical protein
MLAALSLVFLTAAGPFGIRPTPTYREVIDRVCAMPDDYELQSRAQNIGFNVLNVMWEDTGRMGGSSIGPNISDLTLQVREKVAGGTETHLLPVIRYPNFTDKTGDVRAEKMWVRVGNQKKDGELEAVPLGEVLKNLKSYLSDPASLKGTGDLSADRDTHFLVSAQHVFVPIPKGGKAEFNPVIFNYQSAPGSPAIMTLLVTREGLSATVIENISGGNYGGDQSYQGWGQQLFFNNAGQRTVFTAERKSDVKARIESGQAKPADAGALEEGADMMMVVQVPLIHENRGYMGGLAGSAAMGAADDMKMAAPSAAPAMQMRERSNVEQAVLGHGDDQGPFAEMNGLKLVRDKRFPVRVTVQFYRATSNGVVNQQDLADVKRLIDKVYADADYVGSLVVPEGERNRPTDWLKDHPNAQWSPWPWRWLTRAK